MNRGMPMLKYPSPGVYVEKRPSYPSALKLQTGGLTGFAGVAQRGPLNEPVRIRSWDEFKDRFGELISHGSLPRAVQGYFENGGQECIIIRIAHLGSQAASGSAAKASLKIYDHAQNPCLECEAVDEGSWGNNLNLSLVPLEGPEASFHLFLKYHKNREQFLFLSLDPAHPNYAADKINRNSRWIRIKPIAAVPKKKQPLPAMGNQCLENGQDGLAGIETGDIIGTTHKDNSASGIHLLESMEEVTMLAVPDAVNPVLFAAETYQQSVEAVHKTLIDICEKHPLRFCILDTPEALDLSQTAGWRAKFDTARAALYYPWIRVWDEAGNKMISQPPSGHLAGIYSRLDRETKMLKHPANEPIRGAIGTTRDLDENSREFLHPLGINAIRIFKGRGIRVWGARTLSSNPEWRYINTRRLISRVEQTLSEGMQWVVFESNNEALWKTVIRGAAGFLLELWRAGYLAGTVPEDAFYVKCDEELNPEAAQAAGILNVEIGLAAAKPAEFMVVRIKEKTREE